MTAAARQKKRREREALGLAVYRVEVGAEVLDSLEMAGLLKEQHMADREKVAAALGMALSGWAAEILASRVTLIARGRQ